MGQFHIKCLHLSQTEVLLNLAEAPDKIVGVEWGGYISYPTLNPIECKQLGPTGIGIGRVPLESGKSVSLTHGGPIYGSFCGTDQAHQDLHWIERYINEEKHRRSRQFDHCHSRACLTAHLILLNRTMAQTRKKSRKSHNGENRDWEWGPWAELTGQLLVSVILRLAFIDSVSIGGVCRSWRKIVRANRKTILEQQRPLVVVKSTHAKKACFLYNMYDQIRYKTLLPDYLSYWRFVGLSCGYLIMLNLDSKFWLLNLITRDELHFPALPQFFFFGLYETLPILIYSTDISDYFMLVVNRKMSSMVLSRRGGANWRTIQYKGKDGTFVDLTFFNKNVYVLTRDGRIGKLRLSPYLLLELVDVSISIPKSSFTPLQFAASKERLLMVSLFRHGDGSFKTELVIHKLDEANMEWVKVNDMGDEAVFLSPMPGGSAVVNPAKWGGRSNCIYSLKSMFNRCTIFRLNSSQGLVTGTPVVPEPSGALVPQFWYFPHLCYKRNSIKGSLVV